jgi:hypothetical protein
MECGLRGLARDRGAIGMRRLSGQCGAVTVHFGNRLGTARCRLALWRMPAAARKIALGSSSGRSVPRSSLGDIIQIVISCRSLRLLWVQIQLTSARLHGFEVNPLSLSPHPLRLRKVADREPGRRREALSDPRLCEQSSVFLPPGACTTRHRVQGAGPGPKPGPKFASNRATVTSSDTTQNGAEMNDKAIEIGRHYGVTDDQAGKTIKVRGRSSHGSRLPNALPEAVSGRRLLA